MAKTALQILAADKENAARFAQRASKAKTRKMLERAQLELNERLKSVRSSGLGDDTFTVAQLQAALAQVRAVLIPLTQGMRKATLELGKQAAEYAAHDVVEYVSRAEQEFRGSTQQLPFDTIAMVDSSIRGVDATILRRIDSDPKHPGNPGVLQRYGVNVIGKFEEVLQQRLLQGKSWDAARNDLISASPFLQSAPASWAERILRTEAMNAHNAVAQQTLTNVEKIVGPMLKILVATFDDRTGADSYAVHGQIRRSNEAFESWFGAYMHPPNRPNDREIVVPHNLAWPIPAELKWKSDSEVAARWAQEGRKGSPPPRPRMTTIPLEQIGSPAVAPPPMAEVASPTPPAVVPEAAPPPPPLAPSKPLVSLPPAAPVPARPRIVAPLPHRRLPDPDDVEAALPRFREVSQNVTDVVRSVGPEAVRDIRDYTGSGYKELNRVMRELSEGEFVDAYVREDVERRVNNIANGLKAARDAGHTIPGEAYRGIELDSPKAINELLEKGEWTTPSFTSVSLDPEVAINFTGGEYPVLLRIKQKTGVPLGTISRHAESERELLIDRNVRFRVVGHSQLPEDMTNHQGRRITSIELEEIVE